MTIYRAHSVCNNLAFCFTELTDSPFLSKTLLWYHRAWLRSSRVCYFFFLHLLLEFFSSTSSQRHHVWSSSQYSSFEWWHWQYSDQAMCYRVLLRQRVLHFCTWSLRNSILRTISSGVNRLSDSWPSFASFSSESSNSVEVRDVRRSQCRSHLWSISQLGATGPAPSLVASSHDFQSCAQEVDWLF